MQSVNSVLYKACMYMFIHVVNIELFQFSITAKLSSNPKQETRSSSLAITEHIYLEMWYTRNKNETWCSITCKQWDDSWSNISNTKDSIWAFFHTQRRELKIWCITEYYFLTNFKVFENLVKHYLECLIYLLDWN